MSGMAVASVGQMMLHVDAERNDKGKDDKRTERQSSPTFRFRSQYQSHHPLNCCRRTYVEVCYNTSDFTAAHLNLELQATSNGEYVTQNDLHACYVKLEQIPSGLLRIKSRSPSRNDR